MAVVKAKQRKSLPSSDFGLPSQRKYPIPDKLHARVAKSYASKELNAGKLSSEAVEQITQHEATCGLCKRAGLSHIPCEAAEPLWREYHKWRTRDVRMDSLQ